MESLAQQVIFLTKSTEDNLSLTKKILEEVKIKSPTAVSPTEVIETPEKKNQEHIYKIMQSQTDLLSEHRKILMEIEQVSEWLKQTTQETDECVPDPPPQVPQLPLPKVESNGTKDQVTSLSSNTNGIRAPIFDMTGLIRYFVESIETYQSIVTEMLDQNREALQSIKGMQIFNSSN
jgi:hypothetical protein